MAMAMAMAVTSQSRHNSRFAICSRRLAVNMSFYIRRDRISADALLVIAGFSNPRILESSNHRPEYHFYRIRPSASRVTAVTALPAVGGNDVRANHQTSGLASSDVLFEGAPVSAIRPSSLSIALRPTLSPPPRANHRKQWPPQSPNLTMSAPENTCYISTDAARNNAPRRPRTSLSSTSPMTSSTRAPSSTTTGASTSTSRN